jgi:hypothetical protein
VRPSIDDIHHWNRQCFAETPPHICTMATNSLAAALATARETPKIAFAPNLDLFGYHQFNHRLID